MERRYRMAKKKMKSPIVIKKTSSGAFTVTVDFDDSYVIDNYISSFVETESEALQKVRIDSVENLMRHLRCSVLLEVYLKTVSIKRIGRQVGWRLSRTQALALVWLFRDFNSNSIHPVFQLKTALHQALS
jgi:hypothetical protein